MATTNPPTADASDPLRLTLGDTKSPVALTEHGWKITIKNVDGSSSELMLEPVVPELPVEEHAEKDVVKSPPPRASRKLRFYLIVQYFLNTLLAACIIALMAFTLAKYYSSKDVPGAWPENPVLSPTFIMAVVSMVNLAIDCINLLVQCCGERATKSVGKVVAAVHKVTSVVATVGPAIAAGFIKFGFDFTGSKDLWGWTCNNASDAFESVNSSGMVCKSNAVAFGLQLAQVLFQVLSVAVPFYSKWRIAQQDPKSGSADAKNEEAKAKDGEEEAIGLIADAKEALVAITPAS